MGERSYLSIGDVLALLRDEFPDITISKIRFLESRGLLVPERTPSGYRKFYDHDVERLRWILRQQREHFLPLKVIKGRLDGVAGAPEPESLFDTAEAPPATVLAPSGAGTASASGGGAASASNGSSHPSLGRLSAHGGDEEEHRATVATIVRTEERSDVDFGDYERGEDRLDDGEDRLDDDRPDGDRADDDRPDDGGVLSEALEPDGPSASAAMVVEPHAGHANGNDAGRSAHPVGLAVSASAAHGLSATATAILTQSAASTSGGPAGRHRPATGEIVSTDARPPSDLHGDEGSTPASAQSDRPPAGPSAEPSSRAPDAATAASPSESVPATPPSPPATASQSIAATVAARRSANAMAGTSMTAGELAQASGLSVAEIEELESFGLIEGRSVAGVHVFDEESLVMAGLAASFQRFGIEARHLRIFKHAAERQAGLYSQVVMPLLRQRNPEARAKALESLQKMSELGMALQACFSRMTLRDLTGG